MSPCLHGGGHSTACNGPRAVPWLKSRPQAGFVRAMFDGIRCRATVCIFGVAQCERFRVGSRTAEEALQSIRLPSKKLRAVGPPRDRDRNKQYPRRRCQGNGRFWQMPQFFLWLSAAMSCAKTMRSAPSIGRSNLKKGALQSFWTALQVLAAARRFSRPVVVFLPANFERGIATIPSSR